MAGAKSGAANQISIDHGIGFKGLGVLYSS